MRRYMGGIEKIAVKLMTVILSLVILCVCLPYSVNADEVINLSLGVNSAEYHSGDIVSVNVIASSMPHITRFGPIEIGFDSEQVEYLSVQQPNELIGFAFTATVQNFNTLSVNAVDDSSESLISNSDETSDDFIDPSFYSEDAMVLFKAQFRILPAAQDSVEFTFNSIPEFLNGLGESFEVSVTDVLQVNISPELSDDATLAALSISGVNLSPEFDPDIFEYSATVSSETTEVNVSTTPSNLWSAVVVSGNRNLQIGDNQITIDVTSPNRTSMHQYKVTITRLENYVPEGVYLIDANGLSYTFVNLPQDVPVPTGFSRANRIINGYSVPVFVMDGVTDVLVYLYDGTNEPGFYFYNSTTKTLTSYIRENTIISSSHIMTLAERNTDTVIPSGFTEGTRVINDIEYSGFVNEDGMFLCFLEDESGNVAFYAYDEATENWTQYRSADRTGERIYGTLFYIFFGISVIEAFMIAMIVFYVRKMVNERMNPRPKRV